MVPPLLVKACWDMKLSCQLPGGMQGTHQCKGLEQPSILHLQHSRSLMRCLSITAAVHCVPPHLLPLPGQAAAGQSRLPGASVCALQLLA